jgi:hypothetical protein
MTSYLYVLIDPFGRCWAIRDGETERLAGVPSLLHEGWRPIRETPFPQATGTSYILILFERD